MRRQGFTLVEVLTVIAIIALLAAILFPVFSQARSRGAIARDTSNLRQIMKALEAYAMDHGQNYPPGDPIGLDNVEPFITQTLSYVKDRRVFSDSQKNSVVYIHSMRYDVGVPIDHNGSHLNRNSYQAFFRGPDGKYDLEATHADNSDNLWVDYDNQRVVQFRKVQAGLQ